MYKRQGEDEYVPALSDGAYAALSAEVVRQEEVSKNNAATADVYKRQIMSR